MPTAILAKWKQHIGEIIPLDSFDQAMPRWRYAPVTEAENDQQHPSKRSLWTNARECASSKVFLRVILVIVSLLLLANLFGPAQDQLIKFGYVEQEKEDTLQAAPVLDNPTPDDTDWSQFAYCQYVTTEDYLCNSLMIFESLDRMGAKADKLMLYPEVWNVGESSPAGHLLAKARDEYNVTLVPIEVQHFSGEATWADSFTKLLAFNQTAYKRVLSLDSDATVLQPMDELFLLPSAPVAVPRAYWLDDTLSSQLVLVEPSEFEFHRIQEAFATRTSKDFDMEIVNSLYGKACFIIPHRKYDLLTGEFRSNNHAAYLGNEEEEWDPQAILKEAKFLHFSDWPIEKPWLFTPHSLIEEKKPECHEVEGGKEDCRDQEAWFGVYADFRERRSRVCGSQFQAPE